MTKRFYWLKLKDNFFDDDTISFIEEQDNGILYSNFYLKLCLKSLKSEGKLIRLVGETLIPYDVKSLSKLTGVDTDTVRVAMDLFTKIGLIKVLDSGELYLTQIDELIGSETDKAQIMRIKRAQDKLNGNNVTHELPECYTEIEKDIDIDKEKEKKRPRFSKPSIDEINEYCDEQGLDIDTHQFYDYYESNGWKVGRNSMKDWRATVRNWARREKDNKPNKIVDPDDMGWE